MPMMMSPGAILLLRRLSASSTKVTVALISILSRAQPAVAGSKTITATSAIASGRPSFLRNFVAASLTILFRSKVDGLRG